MTDGRGPDSVIDAVGMEAHGAPMGKAMQAMAGMLPDALQRKLMEKAGVDRLHALHLAIELVRRGGTISIVGVYGGMVDPLPLMTMFDNPKFPDPLSALGKDSANYKLPWDKAAENPRSYFGVTHAVLHDGHARLNGVHELLGAVVRQAVIGDEI